MLYVPDDQWNGKLNKVPAEAIESFISAGLSGKKCRFVYSDAFQ